MWSLHLLPLLLLTTSASPLTEELLQEVEAREAVLEEQLLDTLLEEKRLLDVEGLGEGKFITSSENGEWISSTLGSAHQSSQAELWLPGNQAEPQASPQPWWLNTGVPQPYWWLG